ncbi:hypothetical protein POM88_034499 [Heracleum sosnowskyi]|uniref:Uncharacterized protein n=1 Tax=Heracleum sosnowskyi TaxID=360622 RepID=A0AAD8HJD1_9APIA|nr:hypothetical protein POM88_034499 [Heracleum sosnowskyi]
MFNLIRQMPMFISDRDDPNKLVFFYQGSELQFGVEGFVVGFLYTIVGLLLAFVIHFLGMKFMLIGLPAGIDYLRKDIRGIGVFHFVTIFCQKPERHISFCDHILPGTGMQ